MPIVDLKEAFAHCQYPYYKDIFIEGENYHCTLYSISVPFKTTVAFPILNFDEVVHLISIEIIKIRSYEFLNLKQTMMNQIVQ